MKNNYSKRVLPALLLALGLSSGAAAQVTLQNSSYTEEFDGIGTALPSGFTVRTGATATVPGTEVALTTTKTPWANLSGRFSNYASADGLTAAADAAAQDASTDRALGVRQTGSFGDPGAAFVFQATNTTKRAGFSLSFKLQSLDNTSPRTTTWRVDYATGDTPTNFQAIGNGTTSGGTAFSNTPVTVNFGNALNNKSEKVWIRIVALANSSGSSNRPTTAIDDFSLTWTNILPTDPAITVPGAPLTFASQLINTASASQSYQLSAVNLTGDVTVTAPASFTVSKDNAAFTSTIAFTPGELATAKPVYVRYTPTALGVASGNITHTTPGGLEETVAVSGSSFDPNNLVFNFENCVGSTNLSEGWTQFSVTGAQVWGCTTFGRDATDATGKKSSGNALQINGFATTSIQNEDWLISPALNASSFTYPLLSFYSRVAFSGAPLQLKVSTNYSGTGNPNATGVTWTTLDAAFPAIGSDTWTLTDNVDLTAFKSATVYVAFVYNSTTDEAARWTVDDVRLRNSTTPPPPSLAVNTSTLAFGYRAHNTATTQTLNVTLRDLTAAATITSSNPVFQLSKDGTAFSNSISFDATEAGSAPKTITVRFSPTQANTSYNSTLTVASAGVTSLTIDATGNTYNVANTLEVVSWNIEWFGSQAGLGPQDKALQQENVKTMLTNLNADIFALAEVVDTVRLGTVVRQLGGYRYMVSPAASGGSSAGTNSFYATAQKLVFVYRTSVIKNPTFKVLLECDNQTTTCSAYSDWSSGRYPYAMEADVELNGTTNRMLVVLIHAKANTNPVVDAYNRRKAGAAALKAKLDADYPTTKFVIVGDYNDDLDETITAGAPSTESSYKTFVDDAANYQALTLPLSLAKKKSTVSYNDVIDHAVTSNELAANYLTGSAEIQTSLAALIPNYANTTSDHYPVQTRYVFGTVTSTKQVRLAEQLIISPNPTSNTISLQLPTLVGNLTLQVTATDGRVIFTGTGRAEQLNQQLAQRVGSLKAGLYVVRATSAQNTYVGRFVKQ
ncbi:Por secretion system C-terminal sorting domain-containing protein [Hymenobacter gelipurpurascens]|uniref:Por secretion system C-terminal sorting domain-containing protein n=1 Tax=Hymenobacter gelipurpurascens TaxID=89968 RepID=A0A212T366_9BACT|nr:choice-of-anchor J domain-containing protein [Hymenobacter gelipurpurascens]SNC60290.1 Por secretion system C-terminal sorting domain-containing protein [Hymenobacter gelipurpurascens]